MLKDDKGNRLYRRVEVRVLYPEGVLKPEHIVQKAPAGKGINEEGVNEILMKIADKLETLYPWWQFEPIELKGPSRVSQHVFAFKGYAQSNIQNPQQSSEPGTEAVDATPTTETVGDTESLFPAALEPGQQEHGEVLRAAGMPDGIEYGSEHAEVMRAVLGFE